MKFKVGDIVICIKANTRDYWEKKLCIGQIYTVVDVDSKNIVKVVKVNTIPNHLWYKEELFEYPKLTKLEKLIYGL